MRALESVEPPAGDLIAEHNRRARLHNDAALHRYAERAAQAAHEARLEAIRREIEIVDAENALAVARAARARLAAVTNVPADGDEAPSGAHAQAPALERAEAWFLEQLRADPARPPSVTAVNNAVGTNGYVKGSHLAAWREKAGAT